MAAAVSFLKAAAEGAGAPKNFETKALKNELAMSMVAAVSASICFVDAAQRLLGGDVFFEAGDCAVGAFVASGERFAIGGEEFGVGEEAAEHGDDSLVKGKDGAKGLGEILLGCAAADGLLQRLEGEEHVGEALFEDRQEEGEAIVEVDVEGGFGAAGLLGDGAGGGAGEAAGADESFGGGDDFGSSAWPAAGGFSLYRLLHAGSPV